VNPEEDAKGILSRIFSGWRKLRENPVSDIAMGFTPAGVVADIEDTGRAIRERDAIGLGLASLGFIPGVGDVAKGAGKALRRATSDLPMDQASRMARARELGFDVDQPLYHGTAMDIEEFVPSPKGVLGPGVYLTDTPYLADMFAGSAEISKARRNRRRGRSMLSPQQANVGENVMPVFIREGKLFDANANNLKAMFKEAGSQKAVIDELRRQGYRGVNWNLPFVGEGGRYVTMFDPADIRSTSARFDPEQAGSANLLAGLGGLLGAGTAARMMNQNREER